MTLRSKGTYCRSEYDSCLVLDCENMQNGGRDGWMLRLLHRLASNGHVYDWIQRLAGVSIVDKKLAPWVATAGRANILDLGGGTGRVSALAPPGARYICLDVEYPKLQRYLAAHPGGRALMADATRVPVANETIQLVVCVFVAHHLQAHEFATLLCEVRRILTSNGRLVLLDPLSNRGRWQSRLLWRLDRGAYPKTPEQLLGVLAEQFSIVHSERFSIYHEYLLAVAAPG
jgi:SAM-dependent methyltransferase